MAALDQQIHELWHPEFFVLFQPRELAVVWYLVKLLEELTGGHPWQWGDRQKIVDRLLGPGERAVVVVAIRPGLRPLLASIHAPGEIDQMFQPAAGPPHRIQPV